MDGRKGKKLVMKRERKKERQTGRERTGVRVMGEGETKRRWEGMEMEERERKVGRRKQGRQEGR